MNNDMIIINNWNLHNRKLSGWLRHCMDKRFKLERQQNTHFFTKTSTRQEGSSYKNSYSKCFKTTYVTSTYLSVYRVAVWESEND